MMDVARGPSVNQAHSGICGLHASGHRFGIANGDEKMRRDALITEYRIRTGRFTAGKFL